MALFLLVVDLAINPTRGFPLEIEDFANFIFDTDPGIDDAMALLLICASPELDLLGVTTVFGNNGVSQTTTNALHILNVAGRAERYATRAGACAGIRQALARVPANRIDAGLGQVNLGYHTHRYTQPCELLDPYRNLAIAAEILREQHTPGEDWLLAIGRYHRPAGGAPAARYRRSVHRHLTRVLDPDVPVPTLQATTP